MLVSFIGRKSCKLRAAREHALIPGVGNWKWNLKDCQPVRIGLRGRDVLSRPELVSKRKQPSVELEITE